MVAHVVRSLSPDRRKLVTEAVTNCGLADFDCKSWGQVSSTEDPKNINIPIAIPNQLAKLVLDTSKAGWLTISSSLA